MIDGHGDDIYRYGNIRMNFSSNIYAHADLSALEEHLRQHIQTISSYPEPSSHALEKVIAAKYGVEPDEVLATSGATDAIWLIAQAFRDEGTFRVFHPSFSEYSDACEAFGYKECDDASLCWLCNPNNPTGEVYGEEMIKALAAKHSHLVIDQSYEDYTLRKMLSAREVLWCENIIQIRSLTKRYAVPGLRLGFITAPSDVISFLRRQYRPWAVNALAVEAGKWLLQYGSDAIPDLEAYVAETQRLKNLLGGIEGLSVTDTETNFILCCLQGCSAADLKEFLAREKGMLIRDASNFHGLGRGHFRVAAQSAEENDELVAAIKEFLEGRRDE